LTNWTIACAATGTVLIGSVIEGELCLWSFDVECEPAPLPVPVLVPVPLPARPSAAAAGFTPPSVVVALAPVRAAPLPAVVPAPRAAPEEVSLIGPVEKLEDELFFEGGLLVVVCGVLEPVGVRFGGMNGGTF
jgi:hypothetical protein